MRPSHSAKKDTSGPLRHSSITTRAPASPNCRSSIDARIAASASRASRGDDDAFPGGQPVGLDDNRQAQLAVGNHRDRLRRGVAHAVPSRWNAVARHERFRERLAAFEARSRLRRAENPVPGRAKSIHDPEIERKLGPDDGQLDPLALDEGQQPLEIVHANRHDARVARDARVSRRARQRGAIRGAPERSHQRVLAPAGSDDEDPHAVPVPGPAGSNNRLFVNSL